MRDTLLQRFESHINRTETCWLWTASTHKTGYGQIVIEKGRPNYTHRVAWELYKGHIPAGMCVCHTCDVPACVNPDHLFLGSDADNMRDKCEKGRHLRGEQTYNHKLTNADIDAIRSSTESVRVLARRYGVSESLIRKIRSGKRWAHHISSTD